MTTTTEWTIAVCDFEDQGGLEQVITRVKARVIASDGTHSTNARTHHFILAEPDPDGFLAFTNPPLDTDTIMSFVDADEKLQAEEAAEAALADAAANATANKGSGLPA